MLTNQLGHVKYDEHLVFDLKDNKLTINVDYLAFLCCGHKREKTESRRHITCGFSPAFLRLLCQPRCSSQFIRSASSIARYSIQMF